MALNWQVSSVSLVRAGEGMGCSSQGGGDLDHESFGLINSSK